MKNRMKGLVAAVVLLVVAVVIWLAVTKLAEKDAAGETEAAEESMVISSVDSNQITSIQYERDGQSLAFTKENDIWIYEADKNFPVRQDSVAAMTDELGAITAIRKIEAPEDLSEYGLDTPSLTVGYTDSDGNAVTLNVGDSNNAAKGCYLQVAGDDAVYIVSSDFADAFPSNLYEVADMEDLPTIESANVVSMQIEQGEKILRLSTDALASSGWLVSENGQAGENCSSSAVTALINTIIGSSFAADIEYQCDDLSVYGLDKPKASVTVDYTEEMAIESESESTNNSDADAEDGSEAETETETEAETVTVQRQMVLYIGDQNADGDYYVCLDGSKEVHTLAGETAEKIMAYQASDLLDTFIISGSLDAVDTMDVAMNDQNWHIEKKTVEVPVESENASGSAEAETAEDTEPESEMTTETKWYVGSKEIELAELSEAYSNLSGMTAEQILENSVEPEGSTALSVTLHLENGTETTVIFTEYDSSFQLVSVDGTARKLVNKRNVEKLTESLKTLLE